MDIHATPLNLSPCDLPSDLPSHIPKHSPRDLRRRRIFHPTHSKPTPAIFPPMLPAQCTLRPATAADIWPIRRLVWGAKLDPTQLRWQQFWVVTDPQTVIACGQLRAFSQAQELGSLVVAQPWRGQGLGSHLTQFLVAQATQPLYLECLGSSLPRFYRRLGFRSIAWSDLPTPLRFKFAPASLGRTLGFPLEVMVRRPVFPLHQG